MKMIKRYRTLIALALMVFDTQSFRQIQIISKRNPSLITNPFPKLRATLDDETKLSESSPSQISASKVSYRNVRRVEKFARLPVWPAWNGVLIWVVSRVAGNEIASRLEDSITGRVCPNFFEYSETSPFIMLVHHCHSFAPWDPLRFFQKTFFPEGFPAHPHRGFVTLTYFLDGGFIHRDSIAVKQSYGAVDSLHDGKHTQWLNTGAGLLHEEMFDNRRDPTLSWFDSTFRPIRQELYQLWINLPADEKMGPPSCVLLGGEDEAPIIEKRHGSSGRLESKTIVLAGSYDGKTGNAPIRSEMAILHVQMRENATWEMSLPEDFGTVVLYLRQGCLESVSSGEDNQLGAATLISAQHTAFFEATGTKLVLQTKPGTPADFMLLAGCPIREPCVAQGSMVMNSAQGINQAYVDYEAGKFGRPWDNKISDDDWQDHVRQYRSIY